MEPHLKYEIVIGLEIHIRLHTSSKLFCSDHAAYGAAPNTQVSPVSLAHPGTLPAMNKKAIEYAVKMGLACNCTVARTNFFARKNYFYPDLPKGYQISQQSTPVCSEGLIYIPSENNTEIPIRINRIHLEEDAGKSSHNSETDCTFIDFNRAGTPLIELVTEPDLRSGEQASSFLSEIRKLVRYLEISDGNMEEGSLRCDVNISVRKLGDKTLGTRTEIKNLNSVRNVRRAIAFESSRMIELLKSESPIVQETRSFDAATGTTFRIRVKEDEDDYRYFPEPDLPPVELSDSYIDQIRQQIPELPASRIMKYTGTYGLSTYDASLLSEEIKFSAFFETVVANLLQSQNTTAAGLAKAAANWMLGPVKNWLNEHNTTLSYFPLTAGKLSEIILLVEQGKISFSAASSKLFSLMLKSPVADPAQLASVQNLLLQSDVPELSAVIDGVLEKMPGKVAEFRKGKKGLLALFVGEVMKRTKGTADPGLANELLLKKLQEKNQRSD